MINSKDIFFIIFFLLLMIFSVWWEFSLNTIFMFFVSIIFLFFLEKKGNDIKIFVENKNKILFFVYFYIVLQFIIQVFIQFDIIPYSWKYFNGAEHFFGSSIIFLIVFFILSYFEKIFIMNFFSKMIFSALFVLSIGILLEILEYFYSFHLGILKFQNLCQIKFFDTILDFITNFFGVFFSLFLFGYFLKKSS